MDLIVNQTRIHEFKNKKVGSEQETEALINSDVEFSSADMDGDEDWSDSESGS